VNIRTVSATLAAIVLVAGCAGESDTASPATSTATTIAAPPTSAASPSTSPTTTEPSATTNAPTTTEPPPTTEAPPTTMTILVSNDDGVGADGIDALVTALVENTDHEIVVVAPAENASGSSDRRVGGDLTWTDTTTASGYPAVAVDGLPADAVRVAFDDLGLEPGLVISGINEGQNIGTFSELSGTVGAARTGAWKGVPALAVSSGLGEPPDYAAAVPLVLDWLAEHEAALLAGERQPSVANLNVPTCTSGTVRGLVETVTADDMRGRDFNAVDCTSTATEFTDDVDGFLAGFAVLADVTPLGPRLRLEQRLGDELGPDIAADALPGVDDGLLELVTTATGADFETSPLLEWTPPTVTGDEVGSLWIGAFGFRIDPASGLAPVDIGETPPPPDAVDPGPVNEALAREVADWVADRPVPVLAQLEVAEVLVELGVDGVIPIGPDIAADGTVTYLSTAGVIEKGLRLAAEQGVEVGQPGVLCFADHVARCVATARSAGLASAAMPADIEPPSAYDPDSGQLWTRSAAAYVVAELLGRSVLGAEWFAPA
jgi:5'-nucleotidase